MCCRRKTRTARFTCAMESLPSTPVTARAPEKKVRGKPNAAIDALAHDPEKWEPVSRLREARFGGRSKVGKDHAQAKLSLLLRRAHHQPVELFAHLDLARQPRIRPHVVAEVEHVLFHRRRRAHLLAPSLPRIDVAGGAAGGGA